MKKKKKKPKLDPTEQKRVRAQRQHAREIRKVFTGIGFSRVPEICNKEITFKGTTSDIDDFFVYENIFVFIERSLSADVSAHLKKKYVLYQKINSAPVEFISYCRTKFSDFPQNPKYSPDQCFVKVLYCVPSDIKASLRAELEGMYFFDLVAQKYFSKLVTNIRLSARYELFAFFDLGYKNVADGVLVPSGVPSDPYDGSVLPEASSSFPSGYKVVSFYVDPEALLTRAYVLRNEGWRDTADVYQRIISKKKIDNIRQYLCTEHRVFVNNIVVTLPSSSKVLDSKDQPVSPSNLTKTSPARVQIPREFNSVGIIDGQHRIFSYHEGGANEAEISILRKRQNLLATGIIYPANISKQTQVQFEAKLFLEINSTQTSARSDLKQAIALLLTPFSEISIAKRVVNHMNEHGTLAGEFVRYSFEKDKIKTTSIVSYGVRNVVKFSGPDSLFAVWSNADKDKVHTDADVAELYVKYCAAQINFMLSALKENLPKEQWTTNKKIVGRALSTTVINGMIVCLRRVVEEKKERSFDIYKTKLKNVSDFKFGKYKSSQYGSLGRDLFDKYFK
jgi:DGQHR domain-containing protein